MIKTLYYYEKTNEFKETLIKNVWCERVDMMVGNFSDFSVLLGEISSQDRHIAIIKKDGNEEIKELDWRAGQKLSAGIAYNNEKRAKQALVL
jgi:hypothetical protein